MSITKFVAELRHVAAELNREKRHLMYIRDRLPRAYGSELDLPIEAVQAQTARLDAVVNRMDLYDEGAERKAMEKQIAKGLKKLSNDLLTQNGAHNAENPAGTGAERGVPAGDGTPVRWTEGEADAGGALADGGAAPPVGARNGAEHGAPDAHPGRSDAGEPQ